MIIQKQKPDTDYMMFCLFNSTIDHVCKDKVTKARLSQGCYTCGFKSPVTKALQTEVMTAIDALLSRIYGTEIDYQCMLDPDGLILHLYAFTLHLQE
jgi:hypothetical protein